MGYSREILSLRKATSGKLRCCCSCIVQTKRRALRRKPFDCCPNFPKHTTSCCEYISCKAGVRRRRSKQNGYETTNDKEIRVDPAAGCGWHERTSPNSVRRRSEKGWDQLRGTQWRRWRIPSARADARRRCGPGL